MRHLAMFSCLVVILALYGCGGSSRLADSIGDLGDGCQPGEIVEIDWNSTIGAGPSLAQAIKADYTRNYLTNESDSDIFCAGLEVAVSKVDLAALDGSTPELIDKDTGEVITNIELIDRDAGETCTDTNRCIGYSKIDNADGSFSIQCTGKVACDEVNPSMRLDIPITVTHEFETSLEKSSVGVVSIRYEETTANNAFELDVVSIDEELDELAAPIYNGDKGEVDFETIAGFTQEAYAEQGIGFTAEQIAAWEAYEVNLDYATADQDKFVSSMVMWNPQPDDFGVSIGQLRISAYVKLEMGGLASDIDFVRVDQLKSSVQSCQSDITDTCSMTSFRDEVLP